MPIDPELKLQLQTINESLAVIKRQNLKRTSFLRGIFSGMGSVVGVALIVVVIGWVLNIVGVIPAFQATAASWKQTLEEVRRIR